MSTKKNKRGGINTAALSGVVFAAGALFVASTYLSTKILAETAFDRSEPKMMRSAGMRMAKKRRESEYAEMTREASEKLSDAGTTQIEISSSDGIKLVGHYYPCEKAKRVVIAMHGWRSSWFRDFGNISDFLHDSGCSVLFAEQRGQNNSGGDYIGFGVTERKDCLDWIKWVEENVGESLPIYLYGISMGATTVLMASGLELPDSVHGIISDCGFTSPEMIWKHVANDNLHISFWYRKNLINSMYNRRVNMKADDYSTVDALKQTKTPVLFIHGTDDHFVPIEMTYENYKACASPKKLLVVPGASHGNSYLVDREGYEKAVEEFWKDND